MHPSHRNHGEETLDDLDLFGFTRESVAPFAERAIGAPLRTFASEVRGIDALPGTDEYGVCGA